MKYYAYSDGSFYLGWYKVYKRDELPIEIPSDHGRSKRAASFCWDVK